MSSTLPSEPTGERHDRFPRDLMEEITMEIAAEEAGVTPPADLGQFRDDGPDPLGIGWKWALPDRVAAQVTGATNTDVPLSGDARVSPLSTTGAAERTVAIVRRFTNGAYAVGGVLAASLLLGAGVLVGTWRNEPQTTPFDVSAERLQLLGTDKPAPVFVSPMRGYVAAVGVSPSGKAVVWPSEDGRAGRPVRVAEGEQVRVGPFPDDIKAVLVVVTEQPATDDLIREFGTGVLPPGDRVRLPERVTSTLRGLNYRHLAIGQAEYQSGP